MENNEMKIILERLDNMDGKISAIDSKVSSIQLTIENENQEQYTDYSGRAYNPRKKT